MTYCMYCTKKIDEGNLNHDKEIICGKCVQKLIGGPGMPTRRPKKPATARKVRGAGPGKGKNPPTGVE